MASLALLLLTLGILCNNVATFRTSNTSTKVYLAAATFKIMKVPSILPFPSDRRTGKTSPRTRSNTTLVVLILIMAGDIESNPGPLAARNYFPCGLCEKPVTWSTEGVCCDDCSMWHHKSCIDLCS